MPSNLITPTFEEVVNRCVQAGSAPNFIIILLDDAGFVLTLMKLGSKSAGSYPANFHVGFFLDSEAKVDAIHGRMVADGLDVAAPKREHSYSFYVSAPGGFLVEVGA